MADDVIVLNQGLESRTKKSGKRRYTIAVKSEPVIVNLNPRALGKPIAEAIAHHFRQRVAGISAVAAPATIKAREVAAKALAEGKSWAVRRYGGGRTGVLPPNQSNRLFNDSGRFAKTIVANASNDGAWRVNVAANRLDENTANGGAAAVQAIYKRLVELVPEFANPALLLENDLLRKAIERSTHDMVKKAKARTSELRIEMARQLFDIGRQVVEILAG